jgi:cytochrome c oxidase assembly protein subunit 15
LLIWVGGLTRLTGSGLSITEWELFSGILPPLNQNKWNEYFDLYKQIPEYKKINYGMSLSEFKFIFWWEYIHRVLARFLVLFYIIPFVYFFLKNKIRKNEIYFFLLIFIFFLLQGFMGWYMVKSGLVSDTDVSHYRLAAHLSLAIIIYCMIFWSLLNYKKKIFLNYKIATFLILFLIILILVQIIWGAFTSGLNAGLLYQTWPLMNEQFIANDVNIKNIISIESLSNPSYVQLLHRLLAYFIILYTFSIYFFYFRRMNITKPFKLIFFAICIQVVLGIFTLISNLNIYLASLHQIGSILLISCTIYTLFYVNKQQNLIDS